MVNMTDIREMDEEQMEATLKEAYLELFRLKVKAQTDRLDQPSELLRNRKLVARIKTVQSERRNAAIAAAKADANSNAAEVKSAEAVVKADA